MGPTASGKTDLSIELARQYGGVILSLDSLSIYKEIDIASAKPTLHERAGIPHFGIDVVTPDKHFSVATFIDLFKEAKRYAETYGKHLFIVGGTSFYLKALTEGISDIPPIDENVEAEVKKIVSNLSDAHKRLASIDPIYTEKIALNDRYRIEKGLQLYLQTGKEPSRYFAEHPPAPIVRDLSLFEIGVERVELHQRIERRTASMIEAGLVDEVSALEKRYGREPSAMKAIGIIEVLDYFDGKLSFGQMQERIVIHTRQLAKRQCTFNSTQFPPHPKLGRDELKEKISEVLER
ncbi:tRNA dimethylallyltransferase [Hydrogenimonas cancrithermarum]|uniref:tRNA dimethylallyltransferase n=1 Tax=Hydrogenimonas cancrithermarum TaxID=2993563 RepID=A0ABM8FLQ2_9BACT|nr:tRNA dimethylallyltransferase [Hydrogenimonas cancrithermarum]